MIRPVETLTTILTFERYNLKRFHINVIPNNTKFIFTYRTHDKIISLLLYYQNLKSVLYIYNLYYIILNGD